jgi:hypothetical protein
MRRGIIASVAGLFVFSSVLAAVSQNRGTAGPFKIEDLSFLTGDWLATSGAMQVDEHWTAVAGGTLMGLSRTVNAGRTVGFEYLRIETRPEGIFYVAHPRAKSPGTDFKLVRLQDREAVFENLAHDFPKRIIYRRNPDGSLTARVEGDGTEKEKAQEFQYKAMVNK